MVLSGHMATGHGAWSCRFLRPSFPHSLTPFPACIECVMIAREKDKAGQRGADELGKRLEERGIEVIMVERA